MSSDSSINISEITKQWSLARGLKTEYFKSIDSTNLLAKENAFSETELDHEVILYIADHQTEGRGRFDRTWSSAKNGSQLLCSWSFMVSETPSIHFTAKIGLALINALKSTWSFIPFQLKAPNDILINNNKVAGILVETVNQGDEFRLIIGLGLNVLNHPTDVSVSTSLLKNLTSETPLIGDDWILFLDRFLFEISSMVPHSHLDLNTTEQFNFLAQLNKKYESFQEIDWNI